LPPEQYGVFALAYASFLLFSMLYSACVYEPVIVFGSGKYAGRLQGYLRLLMRANVLVLVTLCLVMLLVSLLLGRFYSRSVEYAFAALAVAGPLILTTWLGRAGFYARLQPGTVAVGGAFYFSTLVGTVVALRLSNQLSPVTAFLAMGLAALIANLFLLLRLRLRWNEGPDDPNLTTVLEDHWRYGRWAMASAAVAWFPENIYYAILPARLGLEGAAALRALINFVNPVTHTLTALAALLIPTLVRHSSLGGISQMKRTMGMMLGFLLPASLLYWLALMLCRPLLFGFLYGGKYQAYAFWPLVVAGSLPVSATAAMVLGAGLRAMERPDAIFWCYVAAGITTLIVGLPFTAKWGVLGATGGMLASGWASALSMAWFFHRSTHAMATGTEHL
jgi:O-antigen/teichoic acid export membrane protein